MQDQPTAAELVEAVAEFIRNHAMSQLQGHTAFHARVAANALDIVKRELEIAPSANTGEAARLKALLGREGTLEELNRELCARIENGAIGLETPGLTDHLWATTLTKLAIDQPNYSGYKRAVEEGR
ncbi:MAG: DUF6285 domain-containing protein [Parvibaculum sp.]|nr:DUF6285 domain-containing protein [Parvibaculum sp.]